ncbi:MAG: DUF5668 domain-containing protein [Dehalococcoidia bacterium]|nr:DUF5668 domain-containing protein [Dehalococcoidia bacterium]
MSTHQRPSSRFSLGAFILIVLEVVFLLQNLGIVSWQVWGVLWRFWPVILILIGVNIVWGRHSRWLMPAVSAIAVVGVVGAAVWIQEPAPPEPATTLSQPLQ